MVPQTYISGLLGKSPSSGVCWEEENHQALGSPGLIFLPNLIENLVWMAEREIVTSGQ